ncbi:MAG TPA: 16S rRNA (guanine(966)-N(2))-methyltransferase RsmD [Candidatus Eisenbacteria bacterium]|nr:16S rRNA (guanine(966)-N(2))-methyltransferase RsmD [Candidatus Eisenbacteria bacterium]
MGLIRVVGGALRGRRIAVPDRGVRPTSERTREAIFDLLGPDRVPGARVLDLYAGTGALGIEALSRGAASADFVEKDPAAARRLTETLAKLGLSDVARVHRADLDGGELPEGAVGPWEIVFLDPPYAGGAGAKWLAALAEGGWEAGEGLVIHERARATPAAAPEGLSLWKERTYGDTTVAIYRRGGGV